MSADSTTRARFGVTLPGGKVGRVAGSSRWRWPRRIVVVAVTVGAVAAWRERKLQENARRFGLEPEG